MNALVNTGKGTGLEEETMSLFGHVELEVSSWPLGTGLELRKEAKVGDTDLEITNIYN